MAEAVTGSSRTLWHLVRQLSGSKKARGPKPNEAGSTRPSGQPVGLIVQIALGTLRLSRSRTFGKFGSNWLQPATPLMWTHRGLELGSLARAYRTAVALAKKICWARRLGWNVVKALSLSWFVGLAFVLRQIETAGPRPQGLDAHVAMIPKAEGDSTPLGQRPSSLCVLPAVYRLRASVRLAHIQDWFYSWVPDSVFSAGKGVSSVDAWYSTTKDIEEVLSNTRQGDFHIFVVDVVQSFDTVTRDILDCALGRLGLPAWFRRIYFSFHKEVRLRFKLAVFFKLLKLKTKTSSKKKTHRHGIYYFTLRTLVPAFGSTQRPQRHHAPAVC